MTAYMQFFFNSVCGPRANGIQEGGKQFRADVRLKTEASRERHPFTGRTRITGNIMKAARKLHDLGQSLWLDNITRDLLTSGTLQRYINDLPITGLTSNPTIFDHAISKSHSYDADIAR